MIVNPQNLRGIYVGFNTLFNRALTTVNPLYTEVATVTPSTTDAETYAWLGDIPGMREWIGDREVQNLSASDYTIKNKDFELTIGIDRNAIEDDKIGLFNPSIEMLGQSAAMHPDKLVFSLLKNGFNEKCFDGKAFFSSEHMIGKSKVSNKGTAKLSLDAYIAARSGMMSLTNSKGEALNLVPNLLVVPPALEKAAMDITEADFINGTRNTMRGTAKPLVVPQLAGSDTAWFLMCTTMPVKPLIYQRRKKVKFVSKTNETDDNVFMSKTFVYGADSRGTRASASGRWPTAATGPPAIDRYELLHTQRGPGHAERGCCESNPHRYRLH